jgi:hypothetical protein
MSHFEAGGVMRSIRVLTIIYLAQAAAGIAVGFAYAVWLMYLA